MRQTEINKIIDAKEVTGLSAINEALGNADRLARAMNAGIKIVIDPSDPVASMRNFTKVLDATYARESKTYSLVEYIDDAQEES